MRIAAASLLLIMLAAAENGVEPGPVGTVRADHDRFLSIDEVVALDMDPGLMVKGDRLDLVGAPEVGEAETPRFERKAGRLIVISGSGEPPRGKIISITREVSGPARLFFTLDEAEQLNRYLPFLQAMADTYIADTESLSVRVAVVDVTNPSGDRTRATDAVFDDLRRHVCARTQFSCVNRETLARELWKEGVSTSRSIDAFVEKKLRSSLNADLIVTGHMRRTEAGVDVIVMARTTDMERRPRRMWKRFSFGEPAPAGPAADDVTVRFERRKRGRLRVRLVDVPTVEGMRADFFSYVDIGARGAVAKDFFFSLDGYPGRLDTGGVFFDNFVKAGEHTILFGYRPATAERAGEHSQWRRPVQQTMKITVYDGQSLTLDIVGKVEGRYAVIAADMLYEK